MDIVMMNNTTSGDDHQAESLGLNMTERWFEAVILTIVALISLIGNISLWIIVIRNIRLRNCSNFLVLCLSSADILVSAVNMPVIVYTILAGDWLFPKAACTVLGYITMLTFVASVMSLGAISFNRYIMICHPARFKSVYTKRNTGLIILGVWLFSALLALPPLVGWATYDYLPGQSFCFCDWKTSISYTFFMVFTCFGGPLSAMTFCYVKILREVLKSRKKVLGSSISGKAKPSEQIPEPMSTSITDIAEEKEDIVSDNDTSYVQSKEKLHPENNNTNNNNTDIDEPNNENKNNPEGGSIVGSNVSLHDSNMQLERNPSYKRANTSAYDSFKDKPKKPSSKIGISSPLKIFKSKPSESNLSTVELMKLRKKEKRRQEELRLTTSFVVVIFCFILCWFPFCITMFWSVFSEMPVPRIPDIMTLLLGCMNSCCNPIIYGIMNRNFREGFKRLYCDCFRIGCRCLTSDQNTSTTVRSSTT